MLKWSNNSYMGTTVITLCILRIVGHCIILLCICGHISWFEGIPPDQGAIINDFFSVNEDNSPHSLFVYYSREAIQVIDAALDLITDLESLLELIRPCAMPRQWHAIYTSHPDEASLLRQRNTTSAERAPPL